MLVFARPPYVYRFWVLFSMIFWLYFHDHPVIYQSTGYTIHTHTFQVLRPFLISCSCDSNLKMFRCEVDLCKIIYREIFCMELYLLLLGLMKESNLFVVWSIACMHSVDKTRWVDWLHLIWSVFYHDINLPFRNCTIVMDV